MVLVSILMGVRRRRRSTSGHYGPRSCSNSAKSFGMLLSASSTQQPCMCGSFGRCICRGTTRCIETKKLVELACSHVHIVLLGATAMYVYIYIYICTYLSSVCIYIYIHTHTPYVQYERNTNRNNSCSQPQAAPQSFRTENVDSAASGCSVTRSILS